MPHVIVSKIVTEDAPVDYWLIFPVPEVLAKDNST